VENGYREGEGYTVLKRHRWRRGFTQKKITVASRKEIRVLIVHRYDIRYSNDIRRLQEGDKGLYFHWEGKGPDSAMVPIREGKSKRFGMYDHRAGGGRSSTGRITAA